MPKPRKELQRYPVAEIDYQWQKTTEGMKKLRLEVLGYNLGLNRGRTIMCFLTEMQAKMDLLNGK